MLSELRDEMAFHRGIDSGQSSIYSPHPNISISTAEFGGGLIRLDSTGIQFNTQSELTSLLWLRNFQTSFDDTSNYPYMRMLADMTSGASAELTIEDQFSAADSSSAQFTVETDDAAIILRADTTDNTARLDIGAQNTAGGYFVRLNATPLWLGVFTADPAVVSDGMMWYRSDTDKFRVRLNGVTYNLATEEWVTAGFTVAPNVTAQSTTYAAVANDVVLCTGTFTVTLPSAAANSGKVIIIKNVSTGQITVDGASAETIDDETDIIIGTYESVTLICDGSEWWII